MNKQTKIVVGASALVVCVAVAAVIRELSSSPAEDEPVKEQVEGGRWEVEQRRDNSTVQPSTSNLQPPLDTRKLCEGRTSTSNISAEATAKKAAVKKPAVKGGVRMPPAHPTVSVETSWTPAEQKTVDAIQSALDNDDMQGVVAQLKTAAASTNAAMRLKAVESLQWFGEKAVPELTPFMADDDDEVRVAAIDAWTAGVSQMEAGEDKAATVLMGLSVVTDRDQLGSMVMQVDDLSDAMKLDVLTRVIEGKNEVSAAVAREHYKFWTEEDYTNLEGARKWLDRQSPSGADGTDI